MLGWVLEKVFFAFKRNCHFATFLAHEKWHENKRGQKIKITQFYTHNKKVFLNDNFLANKCQRKLKKYKCSNNATILIKDRLIS